MNFDEPKRTMKALLISLIVCGLWVLPASAAELVSVVKDGVNLRSGPGTDFQILFELPAGYPLRVVQKRGDWLKVVDYENEGGWIASSLISTSPYVIVKVEEANVRSGPGTQYSKIGNVSRDVIMKELERRGEWIKVSHPQLTGWIHKNLIWP